MKRILLTGMMVAAGMLSGVAPANAQQAAKIGYINSQRIMAEAPGTAEAEKALQAEMEQYRGELERMEAQLDSMQTAYERQQATLSAANRQERQQELQQRFTAYQQRRAELEQTAQRRQQELVAPIMQRIREVIEQIRTEGSYAVIFDAAGGAIIAADPSLDLTQQVLTRLGAAPAGGGAR